ncbi:apolipoprotein F [Cuculus canorus]|uniref:apolipoprotein F n=1 Tax=Cuculus canorus TaxID=55661 RepID=UPI0023AACBBD|nr:apolipoprotein F [Cuculus canorus]XP_053907282.1 apolipoprotein F [Cuculus canorus]
MRWALLFLPLLFLALPGSAFPTVRPMPGADERAAARALLAELAAFIPLQAQLPHGIPCQALRPEALPGFAELPPPPRALARAAMALALSGASCAPQAEAEVLALSQELGPAAAAAVLQGLARLRGAPAPQALPLLLSLARGSAAPRRCVAPTGPPGAVAGTHPPAGRAPSAGLRVPLACRRATRRRREGEDVCNPPGEQKAHGVLAWVPAVSTFYNLGTSIYYAFQGCETVASTRALEAAEDLGYAGLAAVVGAVGGPVALGVHLGLQPGLKAGVRALIDYFTSDGDAPPAPTAYRGPVLIV